METITDYDASNMASVPSHHKGPTEINDYAALNKQPTPEVGIKKPEIVSLIGVVRAMQRATRN